MAGNSTPLSLSLSLLLFLFLFTSSHARQVIDPFPKPESESKSETEIHTEPKTSKPQQLETVSFTVDSVDPVPLTIVSLRPIGRRFPQRHHLPFPLPLRSSLQFGHRRCHHGHRREISYGNDAIFRSSAVDDRMIPARWVRIRHGQPSISEIPRFDRKLDRHSHHHHHHGGEENQEKKHDGAWLVKKIRKFFDLF